MTDQASMSGTARRTRRQLLAGGTGALAAVFAAEAIARPAAAYAGADGDVVLGQFNTETSPTTISNTTDGEPALILHGTGHGSGLEGDSSSGVGVSGLSSDGVGVQGFCTHGIGVVGQSTGTGVRGEGSPSGTGVEGVSDSGAGVVGSSNKGTAVFGLTGSATASGVSGLNLAGGPGVNGSSAGAAGIGVTGSGGGIGVKGTSTSGTGVAGASSGGVGVLASGKTALSVQGPALFSRSGTLTIAATTKSAVQQGVALTGASIVLVTAQNDVAGAVVRSAVPDVASGSFTVHLTKAVSKTLTIGWFIVN